MYLVVEFRHSNSRDYTLKSVTNLHVMFAAGEVVFSSSIGGLRTFVAKLEILLIDSLD